jgi:hypothetical protein
MAAGDASAFGRKNVAYRITFPILDADGDLVTGATGLDSEVSKDGGTFAECTNEATEIATSSGVYYLDLTSTEMNADTVAVIVKTTSSGAKTTTLVIYPLKDGDIIANMTQVGGQTASASGTVTFPAATIASTTNITAGTIATVTNRVTANTDQLAGQTVTAATSVIFPAIISSLTAAGVRSELAVELGRIDTTIGSRLASAGYTAPPSAGDNADAVWDEAYNQHTTAGSFGKLMDILRKANYVTEGAVAAGGTPTTTVFRTDLTEPTGTFDNQTLLFVSGDLQGESAPIEGYSVTNGTITLGDPLTAAPTAGDAFVILPDHVHPIGEIADGVLTRTMTEAYRAAGVAPTLAQALFELIAHMGEASIAGTTKTLKKIDGTTAKTFTLDSSTTPTSITETT